MKIKIEKYTGRSRIVSLALSEDVKNDLLSSEVDCLFINNDRAVLLPDEYTLLLSKEDIFKLTNNNEYDVFEIWQNGIVRKCFDVTSVENCFFITGKCNSNCIMCPSPDASRQVENSKNIDWFIELASHIPTNTKHITITGGEPFMVGEQLFRLLLFLRNKFEYTEFQILTNGRIFTVNKYVQNLCQVIPSRAILGIPLHGSKAEIHDMITRAPGSYIQTVQGIKKLLASGINVELRMVVTKLNVYDYLEMSKLIVREMPSVHHVSIMAMEMTGNAHVNREQVWIPYRESYEIIAPAVTYLIEHGIDIKLYNFPLCTVQKQFWPLCEKSITSNKIRYNESCTLCNYKNVCGGVFAGTYRLVRDELEAIL